jgi:hypothetical protein
MPRETPPIVILTQSLGRCGHRTAILPLIPVSKDDDGRNTVVPILAKIVGHRDAAQIIYVVIDEEADSAEIVIVENPQTSSAKHADGTDLIVEPGWQ